MLFRSDRKSTRLNSSHLVISYAVFCLKKQASAPGSRGECQNAAFGIHALHQLVCSDLFFFLMIRRPPRFTLFPYTAPSRSIAAYPDAYRDNSQLSPEANTTARCRDM